MSGHHDEVESMACGLYNLFRGVAFGKDSWVLGHRELIGQKGVEPSMGDLAVFVGNFDRTPHELFPAAVTGGIEDINQGDARTEYSGCSFDIWTHCDAG